MNKNVTLKKNMTLHYNTYYLKTKRMDVRMGGSSSRN